MNEPHAEGVGPVPGPEPTEQVSGLGPEPESASPAASAAITTADRAISLPRHVYVHVPLCRAKCTYCDFFSLTPSELGFSREALVDALVDQLRAWGERDLPVRGIDTLYVGGGTPTMLGESLADLVSAICIWAEAAPDAEVTVEANPESLDARLLELLAMAGVTRVSLGVQSFDDTELTMLGRVHDAERAWQAVADVRAAGLDVSIDLMCGLPAQRAATWNATLERAVASGADHVSVYPLSLEAGTPLAASVLVGEAPEPDPDVTADMLIEAQEVLNRAGLHRYEVASYARRGKESRHNTAYWTGAPYLGVGPGAHGMLTAAVAARAGFILPPEAARVRYAVSCEIPAGLDYMPRVEVETLDAAAAAREDAMLGMRRVVGIDDALAEHAGVIPALETLVADGLVTHTSGRWTTTTRGWLLGNEVFGRLWNGE